MAWKTVTFGSVCKLVNGKAFKACDWSASGTPIIRIQNLNQADGSFNYWAGSLVDQVRVKSGDLLLAWSGTPGTSFGAHIWRGGTAVLNQHIFRCDLDYSALTPEWAKFAVNTQLHQLISLAHGGVGLKHVTRGVIVNLPIPLPALPEQQRIAKILDRAEALRAKRRAALAQLDVLTQATFLTLFGNPVVSHSKWPALTLSEACLKITDGTHNSPPIVQRGVPYVTAKHLKEHGLDFHSDPWFISDEKHREIFARCDPKPGDVLYIKDGATTGIAAINRYDFEFSMLSSLALLRPNLKKLQSEYLCYWLNNPAVKQKLIGRMAGAAIRRLTLAKLNSINIPIPPIPLQREFTHAVCMMEKVKSAQNASLSELNALFASLQHRAFRGEL